MRLLVLTHYFWPESMPVVTNVVTGLQERGHEVTVVTPIPSYPEGRFFDGYGLFQARREDYNGVEVIRVPIVPRGAGGSLRMVLNYSSAAFFTSLKMFQLARRDFDAALVFNPSPVTTCFPGRVLKALSRTPVLVWVQDLWPEAMQATGHVDSELLLTLARPPTRYLYETGDKVLVQSRAFGRSLEELGIAREKIHFLPNTVDDYFRPVTLPEDAPQRELLPPGFRVMFAGNFGGPQDFESMLTAAERLREHQDIQWVLLGSGRKSDWIASEVQRRGLEGIVHLLGRHPAETMPGFFSLADALLVTLHRHPLLAKTIPGKVQAYMACGRPVIACMDGEGGQVIEEAGGGVSVPAEDAEGLAAAVLRLYESRPEDRDAMGGRAREYFEANFERELLLDKLEGWMEELSGGGRRG